MRRKQRSLSLKDCYVILNIPRDASLEDVKHAYRKQAFALHPDLHPNDPAASKKFQALNEAYVALTSVLKAEEFKARKKSQKKAAQETSRDTTSKTQEKAAAEEPTNDAEQKRRDQAEYAYAEQDVLRDLLNDPFARRVFEDIYSELNRQQAEQSQKQAAPEPPREPPKPEPPRQELPKPKPTPTQVTPPKTDTKGGGIGGLFKNWFLRQIDEEQTLYLPAAHLQAGRKVVLQISHGFSKDVQHIEVVLPKDFAIGKPIRLRGLGKHVGPLKGDLYLTLLRKP